MGRTIYIDVERLKNRGAISVFLSDDGGQCDIVFSGKTIESMPTSYKSERVYQILSEVFDVKFIFDDAIPDISFYPIPRLFIFATDSLDGIFASIDDYPSLEEENVPIYYIDRERKCYNIASNLKSFLQLVVFCPRWKERLYNREIENKEKSIMSSEGKYLIDIFNLIKDRQEYLSLIDRKVEVKLYDSYFEAEKMNEFYDIDDLRYISTTEL